MPLRTVVRMTRALGLMHRLELRWGTGVFPSLTYHQPGTSPWPQAVVDLLLLLMAKFTTIWNCGRSWRGAIIPAISWGEMGQDGAGTLILKRCWLDLRLGGSRPR